MQKTAKATLTDQYEASGEVKTTGLYSPGGGSAAPLMKKMRTIEIQTNRGKPLMVLQSEDNKIEIEKTLRQNGWQITAWKGDNLQLTAIPIDLNNSPAPGSFAPSVGHGVQQTVVVNTTQNNQNNPKSGGWASCLGCFGVLVLAAIIYVVIAANMSNVSSSPTYNKAPTTLSNCIASVNAPNDCSTFK